ncbi:MAG: GDP-L-fucose synthase [Candidatus Omnitrophota bacterium]
MFKDSKIYIAGHTKLLGAALLANLKGYKNIITRLLDELDLTKRECVDEFFGKERPEYVFLSAGLTGGIAANKNFPAAFFHTNIAIQDNIFEAAQKYNVKNLVFYGSSCVYPKYCQQPIKEEYLMTGELEGTSEAYSAAKIAGIFACKAYNRQFNTKRFIALIPNSIYGPCDTFDKENSHVAAALIMKLHEAKSKGEKKVTLWGSGTPKREFIFSSDIAKASIFAMNNTDRLENIHYNVGTGIEYSIKEIAGIIANIVGFEGKIEWDTTKPDGTPRKALDSSKFFSLGWKPITTLESGLRLTYEWYTNTIKNNENKK